MAGKTQALGETLTRHYRLSCELFNTFPRPQVTLQLSRGQLELHLDSLDLDHLEALCHAVKNKVSPTHLRIFVPSDGKQAVAARVVERAVEGAAVCVVASLTLTSLGLHGVRLRGRTLKLLCEGVRKARTLKTLHLEKCNLGDSGTESVCQAIKNVPSISHLTLADCGLGERGATAIACLIKHQRLNRDSAMWQDTLRQRQPYLDGMKGLRRLTLNSNPALGDQGAAAIAEVLTEDLWIKAVDLQHCGLGAGGGACLCAALRTNQTLEVVDVWNNPFMPDKFLRELAGLLQGRQAEAEYSWLEASLVEADGEVEQQQGQSENTVSYRTTGRTVKGRRAAKSPRVPTSGRRPKAPSQLGVPWRVEHRLYERREGLVPGSMVKERFGSQAQEQSIGATASQTPRASAPEGEATILKMRRKLHHYRKKYHKEREHRQRLERKLSRIQTQLKGLHTLDEATITHIEECFVKFQVFLSMMQNSRGHLHSSSSSGAVSPLPHPPEPPASTHLPPDTSILPGAFFPTPPFGIPVPVFLQQPVSEFTALSHPVLTPPLDSVQGRHQEAKKVMCEVESASHNRESAMTLNPASTVEKHVPGQGHSSHKGGNSEMSKEERLNLAKLSSLQYRNDLRGSAPHDALDGRDVSEEMRQEQKSEKRISRVNKGKLVKDGEMSTEDNFSAPLHSSSRSVKQKQTVGTQVTNGMLESEIDGDKKAMNPELRSRPANTDTLAMRVEVKDIKEKLNAGETKEVDVRKSHDTEENGERVLSFQSVNLALKNSKLTKEEIYTEKDQSGLENNTSEEIKPVQEANLSNIRSQELEASQSPQESQLLKERQSIQSFKASHHLQFGQSPQTSQSDEYSQSLHGLKSPPDSQVRRDRQSIQSLKASHHLQSEQSPQASQSLQPVQGTQSSHTSQSYSSQSPYEIQSVGESHLPCYSSPPLIQAYQENQSPRSQSVLSQSPQSQSPHSQSPHHSSHSQSPHHSSHSQSPHGLSPNHSPKRNQLHQKQSPQTVNQSQSLYQPHSPQEPHLPPKKRSPKKSRSPREDWGGEVPASEVSETDDEKMRNLSAWLHGRVRGRASSPSSSSSVSISEQLQQSHSSWTKGQGQRRHKGGRKEEEEWPKGGEKEEKEGEEWPKRRERGEKEVKEWIKGRVKGRKEVELTREEGGKEVKWLKNGREKEEKEMEEQLRRKERGGKEVEELARRREVEEEVQGESEFEFEASDLDDLSITGITLTNTSVPEEIHTPGDEDF